MSITYIETDTGVANAADVEVPPGRSFREAWSLEGAVITVGMEKAKKVRKDQLRAERDFTPYDIAIKKLETKAMLGTLTDEDKAVIQEAEQNRERLRNITDDPRIEAAETPEDLKAITC